MKNRLVFMPVFLLLSLLLTGCQFVANYNSVLYQFES
jgi:hypothetical protein